MNYLLWACREVILMFVVLGGLVSLIFCAAFVTIYLECKGFERGTGIPTQFAWGCYAKVNGQWIPKSYVFGMVNELRIKEKK